MNSTASGTKNIVFPGSPNHMKGWRYQESTRPELLPKVRDSNNIEWLNDKEKKENYNLSLHYELKKFYDYVKLTTEEFKARELVIQQIKSIVTNRWPEATINIFGSYHMNLSIFLSDIDISIYENNVTKVSESELTWFVDTIGDKNNISQSNNQSNQSSNNGYDDEEERKRDITFKLSNLYLKDIKNKDWVHVSEFRAKAKVPIINLTHINSIECDISIGIDKNNTDNIVQKIQIFRDKDLFTYLSAFLKVFMHSYQLDKPYHGGIGSFKLYVMIGYILDHPEVDRCINDYGQVLIYFFNYYRTFRNFNRDLSITLFNTTVDFHLAYKIDECRRLFDRCWFLLSRATQPTNMTYEREKTKSYLAMLIDSSELKYNRNIAKSNVKIGKEVISKNDSINGNKIDSKLRDTIIDGNEIRTAINSEKDKTKDNRKENLKDKLIVIVDNNRPYSNNLIDNNHDGSLQNKLSNNASHYQSAVLNSSGNQSSSLSTDNQSYSIDNSTNYQNSSSNQSQNYLFNIPSTYQSNNLTANQASNQSSYKSIASNYSCTNSTANQPNNLSSYNTLAPSNYSFTDSTMCNSNFTPGYQYIYTSDPSNDPNFYTSTNGDSHSLNQTHVYPFNPQATSLQVPNLSTIQLNGHQNNQSFPNISFSQANSQTSHYLQDQTNYNYHTNLTNNQLNDLLPFYQPIDQVLIPSPNYQSNPSQSSNLQSNSTSNMPTYTINYPISQATNSNNYPNAQNYTKDAIESQQLKFEAPANLSVYLSELKRQKTEVNDEIMNQWRSYLSKCKNKIRKENPRQSDSEVNIKAYEFVDKLEDSARFDIYETCKKLAIEKIARYSKINIKKDNRTDNLVSNKQFHELGIKANNLNCNKVENKMDTKRLSEIYLSNKLKKQKFVVEREDGEVLDDHDRDSYGDFINDEIDGKIELKSNQRIPDDITMTSDKKENDEYRKLVQKESIKSNNDSLNCEVPKIEGNITNSTNLSERKNRNDIDDIVNCNTDSTKDENIENKNTSINKNASLTIINQIDKETHLKSLLGKFVDKSIAKSDMKIDNKVSKQKDATINGFDNGLNIISKPIDKKVEEKIVINLDNKEEKSKNNKKLDSIKNPDMIDNNLNIFNGIIENQVTSATTDIVNKSADSLIPMNLEDFESNKLLINKNTENSKPFYEEDKNNSTALHNQVSMKGNVTLVSTALLNQVSMTGNITLDNKLDERIDSDVVMDIDDCTDVTVNSSKIDEKYGNGIDIDIIDDSTSGSHNDMTVNPVTKAPIFPFENKLASSNSEITNKEGSKISTYENISCYCEIEIDSEIDNNVDIVVDTKIDNYKEDVYMSENLKEIDINYKSENRMDSNVRLSFIAKHFNEIKKYRTKILAIQWRKFRNKLKLSINQSFRPSSTNGLLSKSISKIKRRKIFKNIFKKAKNNNNDFIHQNINRKVNKLVDRWIDRKIYKLLNRKNKAMNELNVDVYEISKNINRKEEMTVHEIFNQSSTNFNYTNNLKEISILKKLIKYNNKQNLLIQQLITLKSNEKNIL